MAEDEDPAARLDAAGKRLGEISAAMDETKRRQDEIQRRQDELLEQLAKLNRAIDGDKPE
jgi:predicted transcriptional regulator